MTGPIFLFEDDTTLRDTLVRVLRQAGYTVRPFGSSAAMHAMLEQKRPRLVVTDSWGLSANTLGVSERRELAFLGAAVPTVVISGRPWARGVTAEQIGVASVLRKPFDADDLLREVAQALARAVTTV